MGRIPTIEHYLKAPAHPLRQTGGRYSNIEPRSVSGNPLVTVYSIVKNRKKTLLRTMISVFNQSYSNIEYIVIDGASTDGTLEVIKQCDNKIDLWISEPDSGSSDAVNKAISLARGDIVFWLSSDDWVASDFIEIAVQALLKSDVDFVFGNVVMYKDGTPAGLIQGYKKYEKLLMSGSPHFSFPSMVIKKECFKKVGLLDTTYKIINDYEWTLRLHTNGGRGFYESKVAVCKEIGGIADSHPFQNMVEHLRLLRLYRLLTFKSMAMHIHSFAIREIKQCVKMLLPDSMYKKFCHEECKKKQKITI